MTNHESSSDGMIRRTDVSDVHVTTAAIASDGSVTWADSLGSGDTEIVGGTTLDTGGNIYVAGSTRGNASSTTCNAGSWDMFLLKLTPAGSRVWIQQVWFPNGTFS